MSGSDKRPTSEDLNPLGLTSVGVTSATELNFLELIDRAVDAVDGSAEESDLLARATERFNPSTDDINSHVGAVGAVGASVLWFACSLAHLGKTALLEKVLANWGELAHKPDLNLSQLHDDNRLKGVSVFWSACCLAENGQVALLDIIIANWSTLEPKPNLNLSPLHDDEPFKGVSVFWYACRLAEKNKQKLLNMLVTRWDELEPQPDVNLAPMHDASPINGISVFWVACLLAKVKKNPALLNKIIIDWDKLKPKPNLNVAPLHDGYRLKGVSVFWLACELAQSGDAALLKKIIANWDQLDPKPNLDLAPLHDSHASKGLTVLDMAVSMHKNKKHDLLNFLLSNWLNLTPRVALESCQQEKFPPGLYAMLVNLNRIKDIFEVDDPSKAERDEFSIITPQFIGFMYSAISYKKPLVEGVVRYLESKIQLASKYGFLFALRECDYLVFINFAFELFMTPMSRADYKAQVLKGFERLVASMPNTNSDAGAGTGAGSTTPFCSSCEQVEIDPSPETLKPGLE